MKHVTLTLLTILFAAMLSACAATSGSSAQISLPIGQQPDVIGAVAAGP